MKHIRFKSPPARSPNGINLIKITTMVPNGATAGHNPSIMIGDAQRE